MNPINMTYAAAAIAATINFSSNSGSYKSACNTLLGLFYTTSVSRYFLLSFRRVERDIRYLVVSYMDTRITILKGGFNDTSNVLDTAKRFCENTKDIFIHLVEQVDSEQKLSTDYMYLQLLAKIKCQIDCVLMLLDNEFYLLDEYENFRSRNSRVEKLLDALKSIRSELHKL